MTNENPNYKEKSEALMYIKCSVSIPETALNRNGIILDSTQNGTPLYGIPKKFAEKHCRNLSSSDLVLKCEQALVKLVSEERKTRESRANKN